MQAKTFSIIMSLLIFLGVAELIRERKMTFKYSLFWLTTTFLVIVFAIFDEALIVVSHLAGFSLLSNFIFFLALVFFVVLCLLLTIYVNEENSRNETLAQSIASLEYKIKKLEKNE